MYSDSHNRQTFSATTTTTSVPDDFTTPCLHARDRSSEYGCCGQKQTFLLDVIRQVRGAVRAIFTKAVEKGCKKT